MLQFDIIAPAGMEATSQVCDYLVTLHKTPVFNLGMALGISYVKLKDIMDSETYRYDMIAAWLRKEDQVQERGVPTWRNLAKTFLKLRLNGIARTIAKERGIQNL